MSRGIALSLDPAKTVLPNNIEAEQALLGILIYNNDALVNLPQGFGYQHFYEPLHARLFDAVSTAINAGKMVDPVLLQSRFQGDPAYDELGGLEYVALLVDRAPPAASLVHYARELIEVGTRRELIRTAKGMIEDSNDPEIPADETLHSAEVAITTLRTTGSTIRLVTAGEAIDRVLDQLDNPSAQTQGIMTGIEHLDRHLGGFMPGELIVLAGRPGMGKSAIASVFAQNVAMAGFGVIEFNGEMSPEQMMRRHLTSIAFDLYSHKAPSYSDIRKRTVEYAERQMLDQAAARLRGLPMLSLKRTGLTLQDMRAVARRQAAEWARDGTRLGMISVDHVGLVKVLSNGRNRSRVDDQTEISGGLKELAGDLDVPLLALAQLNRQVESRDDKRPTMPDIRDSGSWEQDADMIIGCYREAYYAMREQEPKTGTANQELVWSDWDRRRKSRWIELLLLKVREGETGIHKVWADMATNAILSHEPETFGGFI